MIRRIRDRIKKPDVQTAEERITVTLTDKDGGSEAVTRTLQVRQYKTDPAYVRVNAGSTKNLGNFESLRIDVSISAPCYWEEVDRMIPIIADKVAFFLDKELNNYKK